MNHIMEKLPHIYMAFLKAWQEADKLVVVSCVWCLHSNVATQHHLKWEQGIPLHCRAKQHHHKRHQINI